MLPEHWFFPLEPGVRDVEKPAGILSVRVLGASQVSRGILLELWVGARQSSRAMPCLHTRTKASKLSQAWAGTMQFKHPGQQGSSDSQIAPPQRRKTNVPRPRKPALSARSLRQIPKSGLVGSPRPMLELFLRASQRRQTCVERAGRAASWGEPRFEFPVSVPGKRPLMDVAVLLSSC